MNGPLLVSLLPPDPPVGAAIASPDPGLYAIPVLLLAGILFSLCLRPPGR
jgi:hypothetical protein